MRFAQMPEGFLLPPLVSTSPPRAAVFHRLRWRQWRNSLLGLWNHSALRVFVIFFVSLVVWIFVFVISAKAMNYLHEQGIPLHLGIVEAIFDLMFLFLTGGLLASSGV